MYTIKFDFPNLPKGGEVSITGLEGVFQNGKEYVIDADHAEQYRIANQQPVESATKGPGQYDWVKGPTLHEAFKDSKHVTVTVQKQGGDK